MASKQATARVQALAMMAGSLCVCAGAPQNHTQLTAIYLQRSRCFTPFCLTSTSSLRLLCASERELVNGSQNNVLGYCRVSEVRSCVNREVGLGSHSLSHSTTPSLINHTVSVDVKHYRKTNYHRDSRRQRVVADVAGKQTRLCKKWSHTQSSHPVEFICQFTIA